MGRPGIDVPTGAFHGFVAVAAGAAGAPKFLTGGCNWPTGGDTVPGFGAGAAMSPAALAAAMAGSFPSFGPSDGSGSCPGFNGGGAASSCVTLGEGLW